MSASHSAEPDVTAPVLLLPETVFTPPELEEPSTGSAADDDSVPHARAPKLTATRTASRPLRMTD